MSEVMTPAWFKSVLGAACSGGLSSVMPHLEAKERIIAHDTALRAELVAMTQRATRAEVEAEDEGNKRDRLITLYTAAMNVAEKAEADVKRLQAELAMERSITKGGTK